MKRCCLLIAGLLLCGTLAFAQELLPDALLTQSGQRVTTKEEWINTRRPELLSLFREHIYGSLPTDRIVRWEEKITDDSAYANKATIREVTLYFGKEAPCRSFSFTVVLPKSTPRAPLIVGLNYSGTDQVLHTDTAKLNGGKGWNEYPVEQFIDRGYGLATCYYQDILPDSAAAVGRYRREAEATPRPAGSTPLSTGSTLAPAGAISIWAWGLMRMMDYIESCHSLINTDRVTLYGFSRLGKAALWAGANDERFAIVISNASGCGGAGLFRHRTYESIAQVNKRFSYWFTDRFGQYSNNESSLPVDQHELLGLMAPRPLYIGNALNDQYVEPIGEFRAAKGAEAVYGLFGWKGIPVDTPQVEKSYPENRIGYHIRKGKHDITDFDWNSYLLFMDKKLNNGLNTQVAL